ncbi:MAG: hypothetical protein PHW46_05835 [Candidatus Omnitrophica bacterium]|nr:hypothetical protein [Candidatus Omnitrophota bacterium]
MSKTFSFKFIFFGLFLVTMLSGDAFAIDTGGDRFSTDGQPMIGVPLGMPEEVDTKICPYGVQAFGMFLAAWRDRDYRTMYELIDDDSKKDYSFEDAKFDFQFMEYKEFQLTAIRKTGENFEFIVSYGDWSYGERVTKKVMISGKTFKLMMPARGQIFKDSVDKYF